MSIDQNNKIDIISTSKLGEVTLTIADHLPWNQNDHLLLLQNKINSYLEFIESGQILESYPSAKDSYIKFFICFKYFPTEAAIQFLNYVQGVLHQSGYGFDWKIY